MCLSRRRHLASQYFKMGLFTAEKVGLQNASIADEHMDAMEALVYPIEAADQLLIIAQIALTSKDFTLASDLGVEGLAIRNKYPVKIYKIKLSPRRVPCVWPDQLQPCRHWPR